MERLSLLKRVSFGAQVAEEETSDLATYFVETDQWLRIYNGEVDVIRGYKGSGKSAIYFLLSAKSDDLLEQRILLITAERPRGTPAFKELATDPPTSEVEFVGLWKLYIASLIARRMQEHSITGASARKLYNALAELNLLEPDIELSRVLKLVREYAQRWFSPRAVEVELKLEPHSGLPIGI